MTSPTVAQAKKTTVKFNRTKETIYTGGLSQLKVTGTKAKVKWKTSNKKVATVTQKGKITAKKAGKATITATVSKKNYKCVVTVKNYKLNNTKLKLDKNDNFKLKTTTGKPKIKWATSNRNVATVNSAGNVKAINEGKATITATINGKKYKSNVEVLKVDSMANLNKLKDYINKNGFNAPKTGYKMIRWEDAYGDGKGEGVYVISNNELQFSSYEDGEGYAYKGFSGNVRLNVKINDMSNADISFRILAKTLDGAINTSSKIDITKLNKNNNIDFGLDSEKNKRTNEVLDIALRELNQFLKEEVKMGLNDLGFEDYK